MYKIKIAIFIGASLLLLAACSKMDEYKDKFNPASTEIIYAGKVDSLKVRSGKNRVMVTGRFTADPKVTTCRIYWDSRADSLSIPVVHNGNDTLKQIITGLTEGRHNFEVVNFDASGNRSVASTGSGVVYGAKYQSNLSNRPITSAELLSTGSASVVWADFDTSLGAKSTIEKYTDINNEEAIVYTPVREMITTLPNFKAGSKITYQTVFLPDSTCIDTFYTDWTTVGVKADITSQYLLNAGPPIISTPASGTDRWRIPQDWIVTDDVKNAGGLGGLDAGGWLPSHALSIEAWWGMPEIPNGKIYQTMTLPAGKYAFTATTGDCSDGATKYVTAAAGTSLPDIDDVPGTALAFTNVVKWADNTIKFELTSPTQVVLGIQAKMKAEGNFMKVFKVRLYSLP
jgi:hypothetical protein